MTKIKICGIKSLEDVAIVNEVIPEYVGFVFAESKRQVSTELAVHMRHALRKDISVVGVFVREEMHRIRALCEENIIDYVQLHGDETLEYIIELKKQIAKPIIYANRIGASRKSQMQEHQFSVQQLELAPVDYLLFDTDTPGAFGGSGTFIDYVSVPKVNQPCFIAGGLNAENVVQVIESVKPYCVDVSSGVETDGRKDRDKIIQFVTTVREHNRLIQ